MATSADYRLGDYPFPRGWFAIGNAGEARRKPRALRYFGQDLVMYRGASGRAVVLDAYCPHMGTHLASGPSTATSRSDSHMEGDAIRCPFHAWRFGADGVCDHIPYHDGAIPPAARLRSWPVEERYGVIFVWHDPEGQEPDQPLIAFPEWDDPAWVRWPELEHLCDLNHPIEIFDNMSDVAHLGHLHGGAAVAYENEYAGAEMHQRQRSAVDPIPGVFDATYSTLAGYVGPGTAFGRFVEMQAAQIICVTPIEDGSCRLWQAGMIRSRSDGAAIDEPAREMRARISAMFGNGLMTDAEVWQLKRPAIHIMQLPGDGPFRQSRVWYSQFYNPRAKADGIVRRVEGIHTSKHWPPFTAQAAE